RGPHVDFTGRKFRIRILLGPRHDLPGDAQHIFVADAAGQAVRVRALLRIKDDLHLAVTVTEIDEHEAAVIATTVDPAADGDRLSNLSFPYFAAGMCPQQEIALPPR